MIRHLLLFLLLVISAGSVSGAASNPEIQASSGRSVRSAGTAERSQRSAAEDAPLKAQGGHTQGHPQAKASVPTWDELAHIHHFHRHRLKKLKKHYRKSVWLSKWLLLVTHAAVLFISYLHVTPH